MRGPPARETSRQCLVGLRRFELPSRSSEVGSRGSLGVPCQRFEEAYGCLVVDPSSGR